MVQNKTSSCLAIQQHSPECLLHRRDGFVARDDTGEGRLDPQACGPLLRAAAVVTVTITIITVIPEANPHVIVIIRLLLWNLLVGRLVVLGVVHIGVVVREGVIQRVPRLLVLVSAQVLTEAISVHLRVSIVIHRVLIAA